MAAISNIIEATSHRPYPIPSGDWQYYQEWNKVIFLHYEIDFETLRKLVPIEIQLDSFEGKYYISIVPFSMEKIRPKNIPPFSFISNFHEINVRTYVNIGGYAGVYFINIEAEKWLSAFIARKSSGLPYEKSTIKRKYNRYSNHNFRKKFHLQLNYSLGKTIEHKSDFDKWLTERYCLFLSEKHYIIRYDIHHVEWPLQEIEFSKFEMAYSLEEFETRNRIPVATHYSPGVQVLSWKKETM